MTSPFRPTHFLPGVYGADVPQGEIVPPISSGLAETGNGPVAGYTNAFDFNLVNFDWVTWHDYEWENWIQVDALLYSLVGFLNIRGIWRPITDYILGDMVFDPTDTTKAFRCTATHTSSTSWTTDKPLFWTAVASVGPPVTSVFGRIGAVVATAGDYDAFYYTKALADSRFANVTGDTMTGALSLVAGAPTAAAHATRKDYVDAQVATRLPYTPLAATPPTGTIVGQQYYDTTTGQLMIWDGTKWAEAAAVPSGGYMPTSGGTFTGPVTFGVTETVFIGGSNVQRFKDNTGTGGIGTIIRTDSSSLYVLFTDTGDSGGAFNTLRPFYINKGTGKVTMKHGLSLSGTVSGSGLDFASLLAPTDNDVSYHIALYGTTYGFNVQANRLNMVSAGVCGFYLTSGSVQAVNPITMQSGGTVAAGTNFTFGDDARITMPVASGTQTIVMKATGGAFSLGSVSMASQTMNGSWTATGALTSQSSLQIWTDSTTGVVIRNAAGSNERMYLYAATDGNVSLRNRNGGGTTISYLTLGGTGDNVLGGTTLNLALQLVSGVHINNTNGGIDFTTALAADAQDLTKHLMLHPNNYGINVRSGQLNYNCGSSTAFHTFYCSTSARFIIGTDAGFTGATAYTVGHHGVPSTGSLSFGSADNRVQRTSSGQMLFVEAGAIYGRAEVTASMPQLYSLARRDAGDVRWAAASSQRFKDSVTPAVEAAVIAQFDALPQVKTWTWGGELDASDERIGTTGVGFIAEEVESVFPAAVRYQWAGNLETDDTSTDIEQTETEDAEGNLIITDVPRDPLPPPPTPDKQVLGLDPLALIALLTAKLRQHEARNTALLTALQALGPGGSAQQLRNAIIGALT